jgi:hypothetical protein
MTIGPDLAGAVTAFNRFGLGARPGDLNAAAGDPRGFLLDELRTANVALARDRPPPSGPAALQAYYLEQQQKRTERKMMAAASGAPPEAPGPEPREGASMAAVPAGQSETPQRPKPDALKPQPQVVQALFRAEAGAHGERLAEPHAWPIARVGLEPRARTRRGRHGPARHSRPSPALGWAPRRWPSTVSTPIRTRARPRACSPSALRGSTPPSTHSRPISAMPGGKQSSSRSPNSAAPFGSTARTAPTMARRRLRSSPGARSPAGG